MSCRTSSVSGVSSVNRDESWNSGEYSRPIEGVDSKCYHELQSVFRCRQAELTGYLSRLPLYFIGPGRRFRAGPDSAPGGDGPLRLIVFTSRVIVSVVVATCDIVALEI